MPQLGVPQLVELRAFALSEAVTRQTGRAPSAQLLVVCQRMDDLLQTLIGLDGEPRTRRSARRARTQRAGAHSPEPAASSEPEAALQRHTEASAAAGGLAHALDQHACRAHERRTAAAAAASTAAAAAAAAATTAAEAASGRARRGRAHAGAGARARGVARAVARGGAQH